VVTDFKKKEKLCRVKSTEPSDMESSLNGNVDKVSKSKYDEHGCVCIIIVLQHIQILTFSHQQF